MRIIKTLIICLTIIISLFLIGIIVLMFLESEIHTAIEMMIEQVDVQERIYELARENNILEQLTREFEMRSRQDEFVKKYLLNSHSDIDSADMSFIRLFQNTFRRGMSINEVRDAIRTFDTSFVEDDRRRMQPLFIHMCAYDTFTYRPSDNTSWSAEFHFRYLETLIGYSITLYSSTLDYQAVLSLFIRENGIPIIMETDNEVIFRWMKNDISYSDNYNRIHWSTSERLSITVNRRYNDGIIRIGFNQNNVCYNQGPIFGNVMPREFSAWN